jgi:hypothetical protein
MPNIACDFHNHNAICTSRRAYCRRVANFYDPYEWSSFSPGQRPTASPSGRSTLPKGWEVWHAQREFRCFQKEGPLLNVLVTFWEPCHAMPPSSPNFHPCYQIDFHPIINWIYGRFVYIIHSIYFIRIHPLGDKIDLKNSTITDCATSFPPKPKFCQVKFLDLAFLKHTTQQS